jgi:hypothetical protein
MTIWKAVAWAAGLFPLVLMLAMLWRGNLFVRRALLVGHTAVVVTMLVGVLLLILLPAPLNEREQLRIWLLLALGALSAFLCVGLVRPSARAFLEHQRTASATSHAPAGQPVNQPSSSAR